ncbi:MAG: DUF2442 domain-containing protein [Chlamydiales bacterium]|nr:DUF2442 domain-containing protein [Chlamydiales bacterium]
MKKEYIAKSIRIADCKAGLDYTVWVKFEDGLEGIVDLNDLAQTPAFSKVWDTIDPFKNVRIDHETHTLTWGVGENLVDINPRLLREEIEQKLN